uniref:Sel1 repeat family protein n=1 Tax=Emiliania huxleyi TaxID=2903 RepID=A0A7S3WXU2_EMIHU
MGSELLDAKQVRSMLARMVKSGAITGDKATRWQERLKAEEEARDLRRRAEGGDAVAMSILGFAYDKGEGVPEDEAQSRYWYKRSAEHGNGRGQANHACKLWNQGKKLQAALLWMEAATRGDPYACIEVAALYDKGLVGHPAQDKELAKRWYLKALACEERGDGDGFDPDEEDAAKANAWLNANADVAAPWFDAPDRRSQDA